MGFLAKGQYENRHVFGSITFIAVIGFLVSLSTAYVKTIWSVYIYSFVNSAAIVGLLTAFLKSPQIDADPEGSWTFRWNNPVDMEVVRKQLESLFNAMLQSPEYQLY